MSYTVNAPVRSSATLACKTYHGAVEVAISLLLCDPAHTCSPDYLLHQAQEYSAREGAVVQKRTVTLSVTPRFAVYLWDEAVTVKYPRGK